MVHIHNAAVSNTAVDSEGAPAHGGSPHHCRATHPCEQKDSFHTVTVVSSPKLHSQFVHRGLSVVRDGLSSLENVSELLQLLQRVGQLPPHRLQLPFQHLDTLHVVQLVRLAAVERVLQIDRCGGQRPKEREKLGGTMQRQDFSPQNKKKQKKTHKVCDAPSSVLLSSSSFMQ